MSLDKLMSKYEAQKAKFVAEAKSAFAVFVKELFKEIPDLNVVKWTQYTPYFNDGDTCEFSVNSPTFSNAKDASEVCSYGEYDGSDENVWCFDSVYGDVPEAVKAKKKQFENFSNTITSGSLEDVLYDMFGDHTEVTIVRNGNDITIESEEYSHD